MNARAYQELSTACPKIDYVGHRFFPATNRSTNSLLKEYFTHQSKEYVDELDAIENLNGEPLPAKRKAFIFVVGFNEERNIRNLVSQYQGQAISPEAYEVCFVPNFPDEKEAPSNERNRERFQGAIENILDLKNDVSNLHLLPKAFPKSLSGLSRARKYAMDYALFRIMKHGIEAVDDAVLISNEGDTLGLPQSYVEMYIDAFEGTEGLSFVQGAVRYPRELTNLRGLLDIYANAREGVHIGLGINSNHFTEFGEAMPIGRNYGVAPRTAVIAGGIDPQRFTAADDDMTFGWDIFRRVGSGVKRFLPIPVVTNPRREVGIVRSIELGDEETMFNAYVEFHDNQALYDLTLDQVITETMALPEEAQPETVAAILNQFFPWVVREEFKTVFCDTPKMQALEKEYAKHEISYFQREGAMTEVMREALDGNTDANVTLSFAEAWFRHFTQGLKVDFELIPNGVDSLLTVK